MNAATRPVRFAGLALRSAAASAVASAQQPSIVGTWEWTRQKNGRVEQLVFRDDGTVAIKRGEEWTETRS